MDKVLLAVVALGLGFLLWELQGEIKDLKSYTMELSRKLEDKKTPDLKLQAPLPAPEQKPCIVQVMPPAPLHKKPIPPPLSLKPSLVK